MEKFCPFLWEGSNGFYCQTDSCVLWDETRGACSLNLSSRKRMIKCTEGYFDIDEVIHFGVTEDTNVAYVELSNGTRNVVKQFRSATEARRAMEELMMVAKGESTVEKYELFLSFDRWAGKPPGKE